jgi:methionyl-tRNA synthetase
LEIIQADVVARYQALRGCDVFFNTGTDEHGLKIYQKAQEAGLDIQNYCDQKAVKYEQLKELLNLSYNNFIRTTDEHHIKAAQEFWRRCGAKGDIYKKTYKAKYCIGCELEKTDSELVNGRCPIHPHQELEIIEEENYFFRFSKYRNKLLELYQNNSDFVIPPHRLQEIKNFVEGGLKDFSISRLKEKMPWGVPVPGDEEQVMYVWFDALVNYISALGWPEDEEKFSTFWPGVQVAGKDNLRQQSAMWQTMLMSAGLPNSKQVFIHGFITAEGQKISKSLGNVVDPFEVVEKYGTDAVRYYLLKAIPPTADGDFSVKYFEETYNADLANGLGNLVSRVAKLCERVNFEKQFSPVNFWKKKTWLSKRLDAYRFNDGLAYIWENIKRLDKEIDTERPWEKEGEALENFLRQPIIDILETSSALKPFLPKTAEKIERTFTAPRIKAGEPLFPRIRND